MKEKILSLMMALALTGTMIPALPAANNVQAAEKPVYVPSDNPFDFATKSEHRLAASETYPESFDLRNYNGKNYVTPVKLQNPFGTCWDFGATAAAETSILGSGIAPNETAETLNLSEKFLANFSTTALDDPSNPQDGEGVYFKKGSTSKDFFNTGGFSYNAVPLYASGVGPVLESRDERFVYKGKNGEVQKSYSNGSYINYCYSANDDWTLEESDRFTRDFVLEEAYMLPSPAKFNSETEAYTYNSAATAEMKKKLMDKKALAISFYADNASPDDDVYNPEYISDKWAHYTYNNRTANHVVTIVGWDDNYSKENFLEGHQPPKNGAWLAKNSWGSGEEEFPNRLRGEWGIVNEKTGKHTGYFWLSYYDQSIEDVEAFRFSKAPSNDDGIIDQHDYMAPHHIQTLYSPAPSVIANTFTAKQKEKLTQVSYMTDIPNSTVNCKIYLLNSESENPADGKLITQMTNTHDLGGFHKETLPTSCIIQRNQQYSIVLTITNPKDEDGYTSNIMFSVGPNVETANENGYDYWYNGVINENESYISFDNKWFDMSSEENRSTIFGNIFNGYTLDNFPIKGYAKPVDDLTLEVKDFDDMNLVNAADKSVVISINMFGDKDTFKNKTFTWTLDNGGNKYVDIEPIHNTCKCKVTAKAYGDTNIFIKSSDGDMLYVPIHVSKLPINTILLGDNKLNSGSFGTSISLYANYTGKAIKPTFRVYADEDSTELLKSGTNYQVTYKNNTKCGTGVATVEGIGDYSGKHTIPFYIMPAKARLTKVAAGSGCLSIQLKDQKATGITGYEIQYRLKGASKWTTKKLAATSSKATIKGLKKGKRYQVRVRGYKTRTGTTLTGAYSSIATSKAVK